MSLNRHLQGEPIFFEVPLIEALIIVVDANYASLGITGGTIFEWSLNGANKKIIMNVGSVTPDPTSGPGTLPLLGAGSAFGFSRRLRSRLHSRKASLQG
jgi:hypothetical protein